MQEINIPKHRVIGGIIAYLGKNFEFTVNKAKIHQAFFEISGKSAYKELFKNIRLTKIGGTYVSPTIDTIIDNLILSRLLATNNPDLRKYQVTESLYEVYNKKGNDFFGDKMDLLRAASNDFGKFIQ